MCPHDENYFYVVSVQDAERALQTDLAACQATVHARLLDNIDTRGAMDALADLIRSVNTHLAAKKEAGAAPLQPLLLRSCATYVTRMLSMFGIAPGVADSPGLGGGTGDDGAAGEAKVAAVLDVLCGFRETVRSGARRGAGAQDMLAACDE